MYAIYFLWGMTSLFWTSRAITMLIVYIVTDAHFWTLQPLVRSADFLPFFTQHTTSVIISPSPSRLATVATMIITNNLSSTFLLSDIVVVPGTGVVVVVVVVVVIGTGIKEPIFISDCNLIVILLIYYGLRGAIIYTWALPELVLLFISAGNQTQG